MRVTKNLNKIVKGACDISLGISIVVAIGIGVAIGLGLRHLTGSLLLLQLLEVIEGFGKGLSLDLCAGKQSE